MLMFTVMLNMVNTFHWKQNNQYLITVSPSTIVLLIIIVPDMVSFYPHKLKVNGYNAIWDTFTTDLYSVRLSHK